jgi:hypothetical protein
MTGLLSAAPSQAAIRLVLSGFLLELVQTILLFLSPRLDTGDRLLIWALSPLALAMLSLALTGMPRSTFARRRSRRDR